MLLLTSFIDGRFFKPCTEHSRLENEQNSSFTMCGVIAGEGQKTIVYLNDPLLLNVVIKVMALRFFVERY